MNHGNDEIEEGYDRLARRQSIIEGFKTPRQFAERIMQLEDECRSIRREYEQIPDSEKPCGFPEERHYKFGFVTHMKPLGEMNGYAVEACVVCGTVRASPPVALAAGDHGP